MPRVEIEETKLVFDQFFKIEEATLRFQKFSGEMSRKIKRLNFERGDSVAAIIFRASTNQILLVNQFKYPAYKKGPGWITEVVAGSIDAGESPEAAVRREIREEVGFEIRELVHISTFYVSPGGTSERIVLYFAEIDEERPSMPGGGKPSEDEDIKRIEYSPAELWAMLDRNEIIDAKTIIAANWLRKRMGAG